jgi:hypothetical protein
MSKVFDQHDTAGGPAVPTGPAPGEDRLRRAVHVALALYLSPALLLVLAVGGVAVAVAGAGRLAAGVARSLGAPRRGRGPGRAAFPAAVPALRPLLAERFEIRRSQVVARGARLRWPDAGPRN